MNSREVEGGKVLPGAMGISSSVKRWRTLQRAVAQWDRGGGAAIKSHQECEEPWECGACFE